MSKSKARKADDDVHELFEIDVDRIDGVGKAASGLPFLLLKSVAPDWNKTAAKRARNARKAAARASAKQAAKAARKAAETAGYSHEVPATNCVGEADSILASVTGERSSGMCSARTMAGTPCRRPAVSGGRCHLHA